MGQYHHPVCIEAEEGIYPSGLGLGPKEGEQAFSRPGTPNAIVALVCARGGNMPAGCSESPLIGRWAGKRVLIQGDYTEDNDIPGWKGPRLSKLYHAMTPPETRNKRDWKTTPAFQDISRDACAFLEVACNVRYFEQEQIMKDNAGKILDRWTSIHSIQVKPVALHFGNCGVAEYVIADGYTERDALAELGIAPVVTVLARACARRAVRHRFKRQCDEWAETIGEWRDRTALLPRFTPAGRRIAICPATYTAATCKSCSACARPRDAVIGFPAHEPGGESNRLRPSVTCRPAKAGMGLRRRALLGTTACRNPVLCNHSRDLFSRGTQRVIKQMSVAGRGLGLSTPEQGADDWQRQALRSEKARIGVAQIVEPSGRAPNERSLAIPAENELAAARPLGLLLGKARLAAH